MIPPGCYAATIIVVAAILFNVVRVFLKINYDAR